LNKACISPIISRDDFCCCLYSPQHCTTARRNETPLDFVNDEINSMIVSRICLIEFPNHIELVGSIDIVFHMNKRLERINGSLFNID